MVKYLRLFLLSLVVTVFTAPFSGCDKGPEKAGEGAPMTDPSAMEKAAGGKPEEMKP
jgi:hypothetical protein